jgi:hypothetical protein
MRPLPSKTVVARFPFTSFPRGWYVVAFSDETTEAWRAAVAGPFVAGVSVARQCPASRGFLA